MSDTLRLAMFVSGAGSTVEAIGQACISGPLQGLIRPVCLIVSKPKARVIQKARRLGILVFFVRPQREDPEAFGEEIIEALIRAGGVDLIGQYGWMAQTPVNVIEMFTGPFGVRMINQHNGPLDIGRPDFGGEGMFGRRVHCARLLFVRRTKRSFWTAATAQRVALEFDEGDVLHAEHMDILPDDTPDSLAARLLPLEHKVQIETLAGLVTGRIGGRVTRAASLVRPEEEEILREVKSAAALEFPRG